MVNCLLSICWKIIGKIRILIQFLLNAFLLCILYTNHEEGIIFYFLLYKMVELAAIFDFANSAFVDRIMYRIWQRNR